jgi:hypothetical protein
VFLPTIVVSKFGNKPELFGTSLRCGMIGDWECLKLIKVLSDDINNNVTYFGKAIWDKQKANSYFNLHNVTYEESSSTYDFKKFSTIDEFHILLGPHSFYNAGKNIPAWESIKESIVTQRLLERVAPQIKLMNLNPKAKLFFYLSDRRFLLQAIDLENLPDTIYAQSLHNSTYRMAHYNSKDISSLDIEVMNVKPFRFETLWLYGKKYKEYLNNVHKNKSIKLVVSANQVTSDNEIINSRRYKLDDFLEYIPDYTICGKWTSKESRDHFIEYSTEKQYLDGLDKKE